jgi:uncharacterized membrane protein
MATATLNEQRNQRNQSDVQRANGQSRHRQTNVGDTERWVSAIGGGTLALLGLRRGGLSGLALAVGGGLLIHRGVTGRCQVYQRLGISTAEGHGPATSVAAGHGIKVEESITINAPAEQLYRHWRQFSNLPRFMRHLESVTENGDTSHWIARGPMGARIEWDAKLINDKPNEMIAWQSLEGSTVDNAGSVHFSPAPGNRGTEVRVSLKYDPPAGKAGAMIARLFGRAPEQEIREELRRFKQLMETGEIAVAQAQPQGQR